MARAAKPTALEALLLRALAGEHPDDAVQGVLTQLKADVVAVAELADEGGRPVLAAPLRGICRRLDVAIELRRRERR